MQNIAISVISSYLESCMDSVIHPTVKFHEYFHCWLHHWTIVHTPFDRCSLHHSTIVVQCTSQPLLTAPFDRCSLHQSTMEIFMEFYSWMDDRIHTTFKVTVNYANCDVLHCHTDRHTTYQIPSSPNSLCRSSERDKLKIFSWGTTEANSCRYALLQT